MRLAARECTMIDWDDVRYFLAIAREGSVRSAAGRLGVNHSTVLRRVAQLEERLGVQMFEKIPSGYLLTAAGEEVLALATQMETRSYEGREGEEMCGTWRSRWVPDNNTKKKK